MTGKRGLDKIRRANPSLWAKYVTAYLVLKVDESRTPSTLHSAFVKAFYATRRAQITYFSMVNLELNLATRLFRE